MTLAEVRPSERLLRRPWAILMGAPHAHGSCEACARARQRDRRWAPLNVERQCDGASLARPGVLWRSTPAPRREVDDAWQLERRGEHNKRAVVCVCVSRMHTQHSRAPCLHMRRPLCPRHRRGAAGGSRLDSRWASRAARVPSSGARPRVCVRLHMCGARRAP